MGEIVKVAWKYWRGNSKQTDKAYFKSRKAAEKFVASLVEEREVFDVAFTEGLSTADVS